MNALHACHIAKSVRVAATQRMLHHAAQHIIMLRVNLFSAIDKS